MMKPAADPIPISKTELAIDRNHAADTEHTYFTDPFMIIGWYHPGD